MINNQDTILKVLKQRCAQDIEALRSGRPHRAGLETAGRTVCCPGAWWVSKDSAGAIPAEPVL